MKTDLEYISKKRNFRKLLGRKPSLVVVNVDSKNYVGGVYCPLPERFDAIYGGEDINELVNREEKQPFFYIKGQNNEMIKLKSCFTEIECVPSDDGKKEVTISPWPDCIPFEIEQLFPPEKIRAEKLFGRLVK